MEELTLSEKLNLYWLHSILTDSEYTTEFKKYAKKNIAKFKRKC
jgi:hypothetical protein